MGVRPETLGAGSQNKELHKKLYVPLIGVNAGWLRPPSVDSLFKRATEDEYDQNYQQPRKNDPPFAESTGCAKTRGYPDASRGR